MPGHDLANFPLTAIACRRYDRSMIDSNEITPDATTRIIDALADRIINDDNFADMHDIDAFADLLTANAFIRLCIAIDLCPYHRCDIDICNDDDRDCSDNLDLFNN